MVLVVALVLVFASTAIAQQEDSQQTWGAKNGRAWDKMSNLMRLAYVLGMDDTVKFYAVASDTSKSSAYDYFRCSTCTVGEIIDGITAIYSAPERKILPIPIAAVIYFKKAKGAAAADTESEISGWLRTFSEDSEPKKTPPAGKE